MNRRPGWHQYFIKMALLCAERATCPRMHCGCVLVKDRRVLATGYNGSLPGMGHCDELGCWIVEDHCIRTVHAEINAVAHAARHGVALAGCTCYVTNTPCSTCCKILVQAGVERIVTCSGYRGDATTKSILRGVDITVERIEKPELSISHEELSSSKS